LHSALVFRRKIISVYRELGITGDRLGLVAAITLGDKNMLDPDQKQLFINAGVMHIMAVSGLHVVILSIFIFRLLFFLKKRMNFLRIIIVVMILWGFAFVTGLSPSVIRATLMFTFLQAGGLMKRNVNSVNSVLASAMVLLTVRPTVIFDAGFLLSYSSVIFIVCFYREVYLKLRFITWIADKIWQSAVITVIAQAGTFPLTVALFNRFPVWFILTNIVIVPLSSFVVILGCVIPAVSPLKSISVPLASLLKFLTGVTEELTETAASLPYATIDNIGITSVEAMLLSLVLLLLFFCFTGTKKITMKIFLYSLIAFLFAVTFSDISSKATSELYVYNVRGQGIAGVRTGKRLTIYQDQQAVPAEILRHCSVKRLRVKVVNPGNKSWILMTSDSKILMGPSLTAGLIDQVRPDFVILTGNKPWTGEKTGTSHRVRAVIVTTSMVPGYSASGNREFFCRTDSVHYIKKSGAYRHRL
jgi:competence protein ComEC